MPKIDTLVDDIYGLLDKGTTQPSQENLFAMASNIMDSVRKQLWSATSDKKRTLRMSNIGKPCSRSLWYDINGDENEEGFSPQTRLKFLMGDIVEAVILFLAKESGHEVTDQQKKITIDDIDGHIDAVIDGELVDVKSTSAYGMRKFKDKTLPNDDPFGYISQISGYANALGKSSGTFLAFDKSGGDMVTYTHHDLEDTSEKISEIKKAIALEEPPERTFEPVTERSTNKAKLGINCSYCSHKKTCWEDIGLDLKFKSGRPVFYVKEKEDA